MPRRTIGKSRNFSPNAFGMMKLLAVLMLAAIAAGAGAPERGYRDERPGAEALREAAMLSNARQHRHSRAGEPSADTDYR